MSKFSVKLFTAVFLFAAFFVFLPGCSYSSQSAHAVTQEPARISAWLAYWDLEQGGKDLDRIGKRLDKLSFFAAYFDKYDRLFIPQELSDKKGELKKKRIKAETYLSFVNDKQNFDGSVVLKDSEVLRRLFADNASMERHIDDIIALTLQGGYDGIEIDYERIWSDDQVGQSFLKFTDKLYAKARKNNLKLRIVLEPRAPLSAPGFIKGPEYVVMIYNLFGLHSGPGPKANKEFIQKTLARMEALPGEKEAAFSTGGCVWADNGEKSFLTEVEARTLAMVYGAEPTRDGESQCMVFGYKDMKGVSYQVWYADVTTLDYWISLSKEQGINSISLWRLGGNIDMHKLK